MPDEIIICDDGSTDRTPNVAREILENTEIAFKIIEITNSGPANARRVAVEASTGNWLAFLDSDDLWERDYLASLEEIILQENVDSIVANFRMVRDNGSEILASKFHTAPPGFWQESLIEGADCFISGGKELFINALSFQCSFPSALMCSRTAYEKIGGIVNSPHKLKSEDAHFVRRLYFFCRTCFYRPVKVKIVVHGNNRSFDQGSVDLVGTLIGRLEILKALGQIDEIKAECGKELQIEIEKSELHIFNQMFWAKRYCDAIGQFAKIRSGNKNLKAYLRFLFARIKIYL